MRVLFGQKSLQQLEKAGEQGEPVPEAVIDMVRAKLAYLNEKSDEEHERDKLVEKIEVLERILLEEEYAQMLKTLEHYEIAATGVPTKKQIKEALRAREMEVLKKATKLKKPRLLLVPPMTRQQCVQKMQEHRVKGQEGGVYTVDGFNDDNLYNGGRPEQDLEWKVMIVEGTENVPQDENIYDGQRNSCQMVKMWVEKLQNQGLDAINDARTYALLMMKSLVEGKPIDTKTQIVLNAMNLTEEQYVIFGYFNSYLHAVGFRWSDSFLLNRVLRCRGSVGVNVP